MSDIPTTVPVCYRHSSRETYVRCSRCDRPICPDCMNEASVEHGIAHGEWYRLITAMFLHYGLLHLALNMYALWILGRDLERFLGPLRFTGLYLLAGLGGNVAAYLFSAPNAATAGASTAVF